MAASALRRDGKAVRPGRTFGLFVSMACLAWGCGGSPGAAGASPFAVSLSPAVTSLSPRFEAAADTVVIEAQAKKGSVPPKYNFVDTIKIKGDGLWQATRTFRYLKPTVSFSLGQGRLSQAELQGLVDMAFDEVGMERRRFVDLPRAVSGKRLLGSPIKSVALHLVNGTQEVSVHGEDAPAFDRLFQAVRQATLEKETLQPPTEIELGQDVP